MRNLFLMAQHEYAQRVRKRSFLLTALGMPLLIVFIVGITIALEINNLSDLPLGYVDEAGVLTTAISPPENELAILEFAAETDARQALTDGEIQGFFVVPAAYPSADSPLQFFYETEAPGNPIIDEFDAFVRSNLTRDLSPTAQQALQDGLSITIRSADGSREFGRDTWINLIIPYVAAFFFFFAVMGTTGYLLEGVASEKENRTIEIMVTTMSPESLIGGKGLGLFAVSLTQIAIWIVSVVVVMVVGAQFLPPLQQAIIPWGYLLLVLAYFLPAFALIAGVMTAIGGAVTEVQQGRQIAGLLNLLFISPFFFMAALLTNPNGPLALFLTLFPTTSFLTVALRWGLGSIPLWQLVVSWLLLVATAVATMWAAARIFRVGMLRYGQRLSFRRMVAAVQGDYMSASSTP